MIISSVGVGLRHISPCALLLPAWVLCFTALCQVSHPFSPSSPLSSYSLSCQNSSAALIMMPIMSSGRLLSSMILLLSSLFLSLFQLCSIRKIQRYSITPLTPPILLRICSSPLFQPQVHKKCQMSCVLTFREPTHSLAPCRSTLADIHKAQSLFCVDRRSIFRCFWHQINLWSLLAATMDLLLRFQIQTLKAPSSNKKYLTSHPCGDGNKTMTLLALV